jgi:phosphopantetheinyl transferase
MERERPRLSTADIARSTSKAVETGVGDNVWRAGRIALRVILERVANEINNSLADQICRQPFDLTAHGEPSMHGVPFSFSQSDAGHYLLVGVAGHGRIGVDLERPRSFAMSQMRQARVIAVACYLSDQHASQPPSLLQAWTRIEAFAKARGPSLARVLTELGLIGVNAESCRLSGVPDVIRDSGLQIQDLRLPDGLVGAVARPAGVQTPPVTLFGVWPDPSAKGV